MKLITLGKLGLEEGELKRQKPLLLLAYLAVEGAKPRRHLAELFFSETSDPFNSLSRALSNLRREAPGLVEADNTRAWTGVASDVVQFLGHADAGDLGTCEAIYRGAFVADLNLELSAELEEWVLGTREYLAGRQRDVLLRLGEKKLQEKKAKEAARYAEKVYTLTGAGELELEHLARVYRLLALGNSPRAAEVREEAEAFGIDLPVINVHQPRGDEAPEHNLPLPKSSFVGRDSELLEIADQLAQPESRLFTSPDIRRISISRPAFNIGRRLKAVIVTGLSLGVLGVVIYRIISLGLELPQLRQVTPREGSTVDRLNQEIKLAPPKNGVYHAALPDFGGHEDQVTAEKIREFEKLAQKEVAWVYFSNNWFPSWRGVFFPYDEIRVILEQGKTPFISMMARDESDTVPFPHYALQRFIDGDFDDELRQWAQDAKAVDAPLLVEFGREMNGNWFPWSGFHNGAQVADSYGNPELFDGQERFRDAYRHIIDLFRSEGVSNITWFFHVDCYSDPDTLWNDPAGYYPGDAYIDWIGISCYGPQEPSDKWWLLSDALDETYEAISAISRDKPLALLEIAVTDGLQAGNKAAWIEDAYDVLRGGQYPRIDAVSWWHEKFEQSDLRINSSKGALEAYRTSVAGEFFVSEPVFQ